MPTSPRQRAITFEAYLLIQEALHSITGELEVNRKWALYFRLLWETGLRVSEALALTPESVGEGFITVHTLKQKGHPEAVVPIQIDLEEVLRAYIKANDIKPSQRIFPGTIQAVHYIFNKVKAQLSLPPTITPHSFRHGFALNVLRQIDPKVPAAQALTWIQRALRHKSLSSTTVYIEASEEDVAKLLKGIKFGR